MKLIHYFFIIYILSFISSLYSQIPLPTGKSTLFSGSGNCILCHKSNGNAMTWQGNDISPITYWRSTMMGNASKDPIWKAMVLEEIHNLPQFVQTIESTCLRCHAPLGFTQAIYDGKTGYSLAELNHDPLANDGVSCTLCHQITPENLGSASSYSGHFIIKSDKILYGPYTNSDTTLMPAIIGYRAAYGPHVNQSELCATCHTLFTATVDYQGKVVGYFPEQTPYLEWKNSSYPSQNIQCQDCHMPKLYDPIKISGMGSFPYRSPFWLHTFVGGNAYMQQIFKDNISAIGATAEPEHFDSTKARTEFMLQEKSIDLSLTTTIIDDFLEAKVTIKNLAGHKLPTGIPLRRMWVHLQVEKVGSGIVFESGEWDGSGRINDYDKGYEPHYQIITSDDQVQVYEAVFADVEHQVTHTLLRAAEFVKDNRIPPVGFTSSSASYDSTGIYGEAINDPDFNKSDNSEGTGSDIITYKIVIEPNASYRIIAAICHQSIKPELVDHLREINETEISTFVAMYDSLPNIPFIIKTVTSEVATGVLNAVHKPLTYSLEQNYPNPFNSKTIIRYSLARPSFVTLKVYNPLGQEIISLVNESKLAGSYSVEFDANNIPSGIYFYKLSAGSYEEIRKMVLLR